MFVQVLICSDIDFFKHLVDMKNSLILNKKTIMIVFLFPEQ